MTMHTIDGMEKSEYTPKETKSARTLSPLGAAFTIVKCNWGIGMMAMPYMLHEAGPIAGVLMFVASMLLTQFATVNVIDLKYKLLDTTSKPEALVKGSEDGERTSKKSVNSSRIESAPLLINTQENDEYQHIVSQSVLPADDSHLDFTNIMAKTLGTFGEWGAMFSIFLANYGSNVAYLLFIRDNIGKFFPDALPNSNYWVWLPLAILIPLAWFDRVSFLAPFNVVGLVAAFTFAVVAVYDTAANMSATEFARVVKDEPFIRPKTFPLAMSIAAFCNEGIIVLGPSTQSSMKQPELYLSTCFWSICFFTVCYMTVGLAGCIYYTDVGVQSEMSLNFNDIHNPLYKIAVVAYSIQLVPTYAVVFFVVYEALEGKWMRFKKMPPRAIHLRNVKVKLVYFANRVFWIALSAILALQVPRFGDYLALIGALGNALSIYIMPQIAYILVIPAVASDQRGYVLNKCRRVGCVVVCIFGIFLSIIGTYQSAKGLFCS
eukprot:m.320615 g.320615  ORF g.320615 m.320615 type:complete len:490 (-) comp20324_c0_seq7:1320-2789(-)